MFDIKMKSQNDVEMASKIFVSTFDDTVSVQIPVQAEAMLAEDFILIVGEGLGLQRSSVKFFGLFQGLLHPTKKFKSIDLVPVDLHELTFQKWCFDVSKESKLLADPVAAKLVYAQCKAYINQGLLKPSEEVATKLEEVVTQLEEVPTQLEEVATQLEEVATQLEEVPNKLEEVATQQEEVATQQEEVATKLEEVPTKLEEVRTKLEESTEPSGIVKYITLSQSINGYSSIHLPVCKLHEVFSLLPDVAPRGTISLSLLYRGMLLGVTRGDCGEKEEFFVSWRKIQRWRKSEEDANIVTYDVYSVPSEECSCLVIHSEQADYLLASTIEMIKGLQSELKGPVFQTSDLKRNKQREIIEWNNIVYSETRFNAEREIAEFYPEVSMLR